MFLTNLWTSPVGSVVVPRLVRSTSERAVQVQSLARDIVLCSWVRHFTLKVLLLIYPASRVSLESSKKKKKKTGEIFLLNVCKEIKRDFALLFTRW